MKPEDDEDDDAGPNSGGGADGSGLLTRPEVVMDKGYYQTVLLEHRDTAGCRTYVPEPVRTHRRRWKGRSARTKQVVLANRARTRRPKGRAHATDASLSKRLPSHAINDLASLVGLTRTCPAQINRLLTAEDDAARARRNA